MSRSEGGSSGVYIRSSRDTAAISHHINYFQISKIIHERPYDPVFEHGDADQKGLESFWRQHYPDQYLGPIIKQKQDTYPDPDKLMRIRPFEAADYVAYEAFRISKQVFKTQGGNVPFRELRKTGQRMPDLPGAKHWGLIEERQFLDICRLFEIPARP